MPTHNAQQQGQSSGVAGLPYIGASRLPRLSSVPLEVFSPARHLEESWDPAAAKALGREGEVVNYGTMLPLAFAAKQAKGVFLVPREQDCHALWDKYHMLDNIREHSTGVAQVAAGMAELVQARGVPASREMAVAAGLLHDLAKTYTIRHKGNHAQLGAGWVMQETRNPLLAHAVLHHVHWPWEDRLEALVNDDTHFVTMAIIYADKRVMHHQFVSIEDRYADLLERYGTTDQIRKNIIASLAQGKYIEQAFLRRFGVQLDEYTLNSGRLVHRA